MISIALAHVATLPPDVISFSNVRKIPLFMEEYESHQMW